VVGPGGRVKPGPAPHQVDDQRVDGDGLELLLSNELRRTQRVRATISILVFEPADGGRVSQWAIELARTTSAHRRAIFDLRAGRFRLLIVRETNAAAERELADAMSLVRGRAGLRGGGLVSLEGAPPPVLSQRDLIQFAEALLLRKVRAEQGEIERILIRHEDWSHMAAPPAGSPST
jgi:hypothetical protein